MRQLLRLLDRGVLSEEEFDRQMRKVFARYP
ncbi:MAG TPA: SHOCT domain-containing protein [Nocardioides sp.]|nr:SHOCT domain-containing protein [Nocardioides sp.]HTW14028.1 SHOCT domain-containing protein [Nocardioides sp.]